MCVIMYQTTKQEALSLEEFTNMANRNRDGMGWMAIVNGEVVYKKGYWNVKTFYKDYLALRSTKGCTEIACHFRIGTGSKVDVANCHPFPITDDKNEIKKEEGIADVCIMMNGIIGKSTEEFSDTALYVMQNLKSYYNFDNRFWLNFNRNQKILFENEISGNRFVFMSGEGSKLFGTGWSDYDGKCQVSNRYWIPFKQEDWSAYYNFYYGNTQTKSKRFANKNGKHKSYIDYIEEGVVS